MDIKHRFTGKTLSSGETAREAAENGEGNLVGADLGGADLRDADLVGADLVRADLRDADLRRADLRRADLDGADLVRADLFRADLGGADLRGADLVGADLGGADLGGANLSGADLGGADLGGANLSDADLRRANLVGANLVRARFAGAKLDSAYLSGARLNWESHDLIAELLRRDAGDSIPRLKVAGLVLIGRTLRWCWDKFLSMDDPERGWALRALGKYVVMGDDHPAVLDLYVGTTGGIDPVSRMTVGRDDDLSA